LFCHICLFRGKGKEEKGGSTRRRRGKKRRKAKARSHRAFVMGLAGGGKREGRAAQAIRSTGRGERRGKNPASENPNAEEREKKGGGEKDKVFRRRKKREKKWS